MTPCFKTGIHACLPFSSPRERVAATYHIAYRQWLNVRMLRENVTDPTTSHIRDQWVCEWMSEWMKSLDEWAPPSNIYSVVPWVNEAMSVWIHHFMYVGMNQGPRYVFGVRSRDLLNNPVFRIFVHQCSTEPTVTITPQATLWTKLRAPFFSRAKVRVPREWSRGPQQQSETPQGKCPRLLPQRWGTWVEQWVCECIHDWMCQWMNACLSH